MKRLFVSFLAVAFLLTSSTIAMAASPKVGAPCFPKGKVVVVGAKKFTCVPSGTKSVWSRPLIGAVAKSKPTPAPPALARWLTNPKAISAGDVTLYKSFDNENINLYPWEGKNVVLLTVKSDYAPIVMGKVVQALDLAYETYAEITGYEPAKVKTFHGKLTIAEIPAGKKSCGAGCGYLGATGIQIMSDHFSKLYEGVRQKNEFDQVAFYELGRNFWNSSSWSSKLAFKERDSVVTGFAVLMRFVSMNLNQIPIGPFNNYSGIQFQKVVTGLADKYLAGEFNSFSTTFAVEKSPGELGATDLWASLMMKWSARYGGALFYKKFFNSLASLPDSYSTADSLKNWSKALSIASDTDFDSEFFETWRMGY